MTSKLSRQLQEFASSHKFTGQKGPLCVALVITRAAMRSGLPLDPGQLVTQAQGQVLGLGKAAVQAILKEHRITKVLAAEGGRTSRGSLGNMQCYVKFLNSLGGLSKSDLIDIEIWWVAKVHDYFDATPLKLKVDIGSSLKANLRGLFDEAAKRQVGNPGATILGAIMQHLVGAKLEVLYPELEIHHHGYSVADAPAGRAGDFLLGDCVIHVTNAPSAGLMEKCIQNLECGLRPLIVSSDAGATMAEKLSADHGLNRRIEVLDIDQFLVANVLEWTGFDGSKRRESLNRLISRYNQIVTSCETDPSLLVELA